MTRAPLMPLRAPSVPWAPARMCESCVGCTHTHTHENTRPHLDLTGSIVGLCRQSRHHSSLFGFLRCCGCRVFFLLLLLLRGGGSSRSRSRCSLSTLGFGSLFLRRRCCLHLCGRGRFSGSLAVVRGHWILHLMGERRVLRGLGVDGYSRCLQLQRRRAAHLGQWVAAEFGDDLGIAPARPRVC